MLEVWIVIRHTDSLGIGLTDNSPLIFDLCTTSIPRDIIQKNFEPLVVRMPLYRTGLSLQ